MYLVLERKCAAKSYMYPGLYCCVYSSSVGHGQQLRKELQILTPASSSRASLARRGDIGPRPLQASSQQNTKAARANAVHASMHQAERTCTSAIISTLHIYCFTASVRGGGGGYFTTDYITLELFRVA